MPFAYDDQNIFAKILRGEIPNDTVAESEHSLAFNDIAPKAPIHILVIPKKPYVSYDHFCAEASEAEIADFARLSARIIADKGLSAATDGMGYRVVSNSGRHGVQEVAHYHIHIFGGLQLGALPLQ